MGSTFLRSQSVPKFFCFSVARFVANFLPVRYLQMNHRRVGSVSMMVLLVAPVLAYLTTHRLCNFHQFCPGSNVEVNLSGLRLEISGSNCFPAVFRPGD